MSNLDIINTEGHYTCVSCHNYISGLIVGNIKGTCLEKHRMRWIMDDTMEIRKCLKASKYLYVDCPDYMPRL